MNSVIALFLSLIVVFFLVFKRFDLGLSMIIGGFILSVLAGFSPFMIVSISWNTLLSPEAIYLMVIITLIWILGKTLKESGTLEHMVYYLNRLIANDRINIVIISSMIGILAVPGGAIMSAPIIEEFGKHNNMSREKMAAANLLFRHIWYPIFPLSPALILLASLSNQSIISFNLLGIPVVVITVIVSYFVCFAGTKNILKEKVPLTLTDLKGLLISFVPLIIIISLFLVSESLLIPAVAIGILVGNFLYLGFTLDKQAALLELKRRLHKNIIGGFKWSGLTVGFGIIYYRDVVKASGCVDVLLNFFTSIGFPLVFLALASTILLAFSLGADIGALAIVAPILILALGVESNQLLPILFLAFIGSSIGTLLSPLHLCLLLTCEHFGVSLKSVYSYLLYPLLTMLGVSLFVFLFKTSLIIV